MDILTTSRLRLRVTRESDIAPLYENVLGDAEVMQHAFGGVAMDRDEAGKFIRENFNFDGALVGLAPLIETASDRIVGVAGLNPCSALGADDFEIGFVLARNVWGRGFGHEIGVAQLQLGFHRLGCARLLAQTAPDNAASIKVLQKLEMSFVRTTRHPQRGERYVYKAVSAPHAR